MPGKSQRGRGKHSARRKKGQSLSATVAQQRAAADKFAAPRDVSAPSSTVPTPVTAPTGIRYPYVVTELRRIGILGGIMLAALVVLALVLS